LAAVDDFGRDVEGLEHLLSDQGFHAVGAKQHVAGYGVGFAALSGAHGEGWFRGEGFYRGDGRGEEEVDAFVLLLAAFVHFAREGGAVPDHVWVAVGLSDVVEVDFGQDFIRGAL